MTDECHHENPDGATQAQVSQCWLKRLRLSSKADIQNAPRRVYPPTGETSQERREASLTEPAFDAKALTKSDIDAVSEKGKTFLYLAYGSNLCNETFRGRRGIKPLSQINVLVPSLRLTFDLPGVPYVEPCFANTAIRDADPTEGADYHKNRWHKGLIGCVYEVTPSDYAHIIATEGGGAGYQDITVDCYPLQQGETVPETPTTRRFVAHTLFAPPAKSHARPDPSYAQPSARYLALITTGAAELALPREYQNYLNDIRTYTVTTTRQKIGKALFGSIWWPFIELLFVLGAQFQDDMGRSPPWLARLSAALFLGMWTSYDAAFRKAFGDGERTEGDEMFPGNEALTEREWRRVGEENGWIRKSRVGKNLA